jgi:hypothetical protein
MSIIDRLAQDLAEILEDELADESVNIDRFCLTLLLLIGGRRDGHKKTANPPEPPSAEEWMSESDDEREHEEGEGIPRAAGENKVHVLQGLRQRVTAFSRANPYLNGLLFRDFQRDSRYDEYPLGDYGCLQLHPETCLYVSDVLLLRRLQPARKIGKEPTNMHLLLRELCRETRADDSQEGKDEADSLWRTTEISRQTDGAAYVEGWFLPVAEALANQIDKLGDNISKVAQNRRIADGSYWLRVGLCSEEAGEELNLREVLEILPKPLRSGFSRVGEIRRLLKTVIDSLNTRYRLLRGCGLAPETWLHRDEPSVDRLKGLVKLRKRAWSDRAWLDGRRLDAFEKAFKDLLPECAGKVGGFTSFEKWRDSDEGDAMLHRGWDREISWETWIECMTEDENLDDSEGPDFLAGREPDRGANEDFAGERIAGSDTGDGEPSFAPSDTMALILEDAGPRLADNAVLWAFFRWVLVEKRAWTGRDGLAARTDFRELCAANTGYASLSRDDLGAHLYSEACILILDVLLETYPGAVSPAVSAYLRWVMVEGKPEQGRDGLFNLKSFKALVASDPILNTLALDQLEEGVRRLALDLWQTLFGQAGQAN